MAIFKNLIVNGVTRILNKLYANEIVADTTTTNQDAVVKGTLYLTNTNDINDTDTDNIPAMVIGDENENHMIVDNDEIAVKTDSSTSGALLLNNDGGAVKFSNDGKVYVDNGILYAPKSTIINLEANKIVAKNINVSNTLRATKFDLQTISQSGGSLYISPTIIFPNPNTTLQVSKSGTYLVMKIIDPSITSKNMAGAIWTNNSNVKVSGNINGVTTGTMDGFIYNINTSSNVLTVYVSGGNQDDVVEGTYLPSQIENLTVMMYQRKDGTSTYNVGLWLSCYDIVNDSCAMRIYGGTSEKPNVMIGNLTDANLPVLSNDFNTTPVGWGLYAQNAYLNGVIVSTSGLIGGWAITSKALSNGTYGKDNSMFLSTVNMDTKTLAGGTNITNWRMTVGSHLGITASGTLYCDNAHVSGQITATSGEIGGFTVSENSFCMDNCVKFSSTDFSKTIMGESRDNLRFSIGDYFGVSSSGILYSTNAIISGNITSDSGSIGGITITENSIYSSKHDSFHSSNNGFLLSSQGLFSLGNDTYYIKLDSKGNLVMSIKDINIEGNSISTLITDASGTATNYFLVEGDGLSIYGDTRVTTNRSHITLTNDGLDIYSGQYIVASYGEATNFYKSYSTDKTLESNIAATLDSNGLNIQKGTITLGDYFSVDENGVICAASGTIGGITITENSIYSSKHDSFDSSNKGFLLSSQGEFSLGDDTYYIKLDSFGNLIMSIQDINIQGDSISTLIMDAAGTATNHFLLDDNGLSIYEAIAPGGSHITLSNNGLDIYAGQYIVASYGYETKFYESYSTDKTLESNVAATLDYNGLNIKKGTITLGDYFFVDDDGSMYATSGTIGGFIIGEKYISDFEIFSRAAITLSVENFSKEICGELKDDLRFAIGRSFGVTWTGKLYCNDVDLTGNINATSGTIGGIKIGWGGIYVGDRFSVDNCRLYIGEDGAFSIGSENSYIRSDKDGNVEINVESLNIGSSNIQTHLEKSGGTATNYLNYTPENGFIIHSGNSGESPYDIQITSNAINFRYNSNTLHKITATSSIFYSYYNGSLVKSLEIDSDGVSIYDKLGTNTIAYFGKDESHGTGFFSSTGLLGDSICFSNKGLYRISGFTMTIFAHSDYALVVGQLDNPLYEDIFDADVVTSGRERYFSLDYDGNISTRGTFHTTKQIESEVSIVAGTVLKGKKGRFTEMDNYSTTDSVLFVDGDGYTKKGATFGALISNNISSIVSSLISNYAFVNAVSGIAQDIVDANKS